MNKHMFSTLDFPYVKLLSFPARTALMSQPIFITSYHMVIASIGTRLLRLVPGRFSQTKVDVPVRPLILPTTPAPSTMRAMSA